MGKRKKINELREELKLSGASPFALTEAYKAVRTNLLFSLAADSRTTFLISSPGVGEGKSTTSANLAITLAQTSAKVLLIDADLRKPTQHKIFRVDNSHGLSSFLVGMESLAESLKSNVEPRLDLFPSGPTPPNPSELLGSKNMGILLQKLEEHYDYILIDTPPVNVVSDALVLSGKTAGVALVVKHCSTAYEELRRAIEAIQFANSRVLGVILANVDESKDSYTRGYNKYGYSKRYGYGYGTENQESGFAEPVTEKRKVSSAYPEASVENQAPTAKEPLTDAARQAVFQRRPEDRK